MKFLSLLLAAGLVSVGFVLAVPLSSAGVCIVNVACGGIGPGSEPYACRYVGGAYPFQCVGVYALCAWLWNDRSADGDPMNGNDQVTTAACL
jgi:hypothetical protein